MKKKLLTSAILLMAVGFISCQKESIQSDPIANVKKDDNTILGRNGDGSQCPTTTVNLLAGQTINAGTVSVTNDADFIYVTYTTANGYLITQTHLYVGDCALIPVNGPGNPIPGQFPYSSAHSNITSYTYQVPISAQLLNLLFLLFVAPVDCIMGRVLNLRQNVGNYHKNKTHR